MVKATVATCLFMIISSLFILIMIGMIINEREKILNGEPTYEGVLTDIEYTSGGFGSDDKTIFTLNNETIFVIKSHRGGFIIGSYYKFWVDGEILLKHKEV
jgi:hypothetical protein